MEGVAIQTAIVNSPSGCKTVFSKNYCKTVGFATNVMEITVKTKITIKIIRRGAHTIGLIEA